MLQKPTLYHLRYCPFCIKVRIAARRLGIELDLIEINTKPEARERLIEERGRATVPVLRIAEASGDIWLGESEDIIEYLASNADRLRKAG